MRNKKKKRKRTMEFNDATVRQYERMIANIAWTYTNNPTLHQDLMQEGFIGLRMACEQYTAGKASFTTYAHSRARSKMQQYLRYKNSVVHIPFAHGKKCKTVEIEGHELGYVNHEAELRDELRSRG